MKRAIKQRLEQYFEPPKPSGKRAFLRGMEPRRVNIRHMLIVQARYIPKWVWLSSVPLFLFAWYVSRFGQDNATPRLMALMPFLVMVSLTECMRSAVYGMEEMELAAQFSLRSIVLARMGILGLANLLLVIVISVLSGQNIFKGAVFLLLPYLMTALGNLMIVRRVNGKEGMFACAVFAFAVSGADLLFHTKINVYFADRYLPVWLLLILLLGMAVVLEGRNTIQSFCELQS